MDARVVEEVITDVPLAPAAAWNIVSDTDRVNREAGLSPMALTPVQDRGAARFLAETVIGPFKVLFEELPFEWIAPTRLVIRRKMLRGPAKMLEVCFEVAAKGSGSRVTTRITIDLVSRAWRAPTILIAKRVGQRLDRAIQTLARAAKPPAREPSARAPSARASSIRSAPPRAPSLRAATPTPGTPAPAYGWAAKVLAESPRTDPALIDRLVAHVETGPDHELLRIRPYELARAWGVDRREMLELCLGATLAGFLALSWDLVCPSCRQPSTQTGSLEGLTESAHCDQCDLSFGLTLDKAVECTFKPTPAVRLLEDIRFCSGGPAMTPHVVAQCVVDPEGSLVMPDAPGRLRLFARGGATASVEVAAEGPLELSVKIGDASFSESDLKLAPRGTLKLTLGSAVARHVKLERTEWVQLAATAFDVSLIPRFRDRFSGEVLRPGVALAVSRVTLMFTDLGASTEMYSKHGDAAAFRVVQDHFELLEAIIADHHGAIVKTIGDAVMAAFADDRSALDAAAAMSRAWPEFRGARPLAERASLKIGLYGGPCYAVQANAALDYFGQTVNVAARLQAQAKDDEIVVTEVLWAEASAWDIEGLRVEARAEATLKGIVAPMPIVRLKV